jgi:hypothetical protein
MKLPKNAQGKVGILVNNEVILPEDLDYCLADEEIQELKQEILANWTGSNHV